MLWRFVPAGWWQSFGPLTITVFLSLVLLATGDRFQLTLVRGLRASVLYPAGAIDASLKDLLDVRAENERLRRELALARMDANSLREAAAENTRLTRLLQLETVHPETLIAGRVVGRGQDASRDWNYLTVRTSIPKEMDANSLIAVTPEGLVGLVIERALGFVTVRTLASAKSAVHVLDRRSRVAGVVRSEGGTGSLLRVDHVPAQEDVIPGDTLVTSGHGTHFPRGIPVGVVARVEPAVDDLVKRVWAEPFVRFTRLEEVFLTPGKEALR
jgi:rod shape-determining protein MreC